ncbi:VOC family protein [Christensenellaceae bacterium OttesenSCG-928-M15]|nr:VOC family protein [Christensenellaceae bacterium OttesenSCG-928-M15]
MITGYCCTNIFSEHAKEQIAFYREILGIPFIKTDVNDSNGVYLGFMENAPTLCIWDCKVFGAQPTGYQSFVFETKNLDSTIAWLKGKGLSLAEPVRFDWGTYELRLNDIDGNEVVIVEFA